MSCDQCHRECGREALTADSACGGPDGAMKISWKWKDE